MMSRRCNLLVWSAAVVVVIVGIKYAEPFLVPVLFGASLAAISSPVATWVTRRGLPSAVGALAALMVSVAMLGFMATMLAFAGSSASSPATATARWCASTASCARCSATWWSRR